MSEPTKIEGGLLRYAKKLGVIVASLVKSERRQAHFLWRHCYRVSLTRFTTWRDTTIVPNGVVAFINNSKQIHCYQKT